MPTLSARDAMSALESKGFQRKHGDHEFFVYHRSSDDTKTSVFTKISHGEREINKRLVSAMARQCRLKTGDFTRLVSCTLGRDEYEKRLIEAGEI